MNKQRKLFLFGGALVLTVLFLGQLSSLARAQSSPSRNLRIGDYGVDVVLLQKILNRDPQTRVSVIGPGSPGNETLYFGPLTHAAVIRFQEKYSAEVLVPVGLFHGTGFVGPSTRAKLSQIVAASIAQALQPDSPVLESPTSSDKTSGPEADPAPIPLADVSPTTTNPNLVNLDFFLEELVKIQKGQGASDKLISQITEKVRTDAQTKPDFREEFVRQEAKIQAQKLQSKGFLRGSLAAQLFRKAVEPKIAFAQTPFGGAISYIYPCLCSSTALVYVAGTSPAVLDYVYGTQAYESYNLPYARFILGTYTPGPGGTCWFPGFPSCYFVGSGGLVNSLVGSSPV